MPTLECDWARELAFDAERCLRAPPDSSGRPLADFLLGDSEDITCESTVVALVADELRAMGYTVARNDPCKGVRLIARIGQSVVHRDSPRIEIRRPLYMEEAAHERNVGFGRRQANLGKRVERDCRVSAGAGRPHRG